MRMDLITFRSVTPAQRGQRALQQAGMYCTLGRTPKMYQERGCGYCLRIRAGDTLRAVEILQSRQIPFSRLYEDAGL